MKKKFLFFALTAAVILLSVSATFEFAGILKEFAIKSRVQLLFLIGFAVYLIVHLLFYKPVFIHVMSHELTHVIWAAVFGGKTKKLEVSGRGGRVLISKSNFLISLAPYFFPLYTFVIALIYLIADNKYLPFLSFLLGASLAFHIALTLYSMRADQSDFFEDSNVVFSIFFVYLMNIVVVALIFSMLSGDISFLRFLKNTFFSVFIIMKTAVIKLNEIIR